MGLFRIYHNGIIMQAFFFFFVISLLLSFENYATHSLLITFHFFFFFWKNFYTKNFTICSLHVYNLLRFSLCASLPTYLISEFWYAFFFLSVKYWYDEAQFRWWMHWNLPIWVNPNHGLKFQCWSLCQLRSGWVHAAHAVRAGLVWPRSPKRCEFF